MEDLFKLVLLKPSQPPGFKVGDNQRKDPGLQNLGDFKDGQNFVALKVLGIFSHPVSLIIHWTLLLNFSGG